MVGLKDCVLTKCSAPPSVIIIDVGGPMDILGYDFESENEAEAARKEIIATVGNVVEKEAKSLTIAAPEEAASRAASICERFNGKSTSAFLF